uniref:Putative serine proteinase inhibitor n=1 Tax=Ixodes ricinus TaxID=34613 RepID=A0A147BQW6_IXORI
MASDLGDSLLRFSVDLYKTLKCKAGGRGNIICSPFSIAAALSMTLAGARNNTAKQILGALCVEHGTVHASFASFLSKLPEYAPDVVLHVANRLYSDQTYKALEEFTSVLQKLYGSTIEHVDFKHNADKARLQVNAWVEGVTRSKIKDLLAEGIVDASTALIVVNAVYFKGLWDEQFDPGATFKQAFYETADRSKQVDMMYQSKPFRFCHYPAFKVRALEIPYKGRKTSMVVVLPEEVDGLAAFEEGLTASKLTEILQGLSGHGEINLSLPKFKLEQAVDLKTVLVAMGIEDLFMPSRCDLSGIGGERDLVVSDAVHKAFVEVNEEGTEAAAATAMVVCDGAMFGIRFSVDHPFLFLIRGHDPDVILFVGSVRLV